MTCTTPRRCAQRWFGSGLQLTDLPDDATKIPELGGRNDRMLSEGTRNLVAAAQAAAAARILAQSIAVEIVE